MKHKIGIIIGSTRPTRVGDKVAQWYLGQVKGMVDAEFEVVDIADYKLPLLDEPSSASQGTNYQHEHTKKWSAKIASFDAYIWVTPEYNHAAPAALTNAISYLNHEWRHKPVGIVGYGSLGGVRAAEHLRQIAGELYMADIRPQVSVRQPWDMFDDAGDVRADLVWGSTLEQADELLWWSKALKAAKNPMLSFKPKVANSVAKKLA